MRLAASGLALVLAIAPVPVFAHGETPRPAHGGLVQDAQGVWIELVVAGDDVTVYVLSEDHRPIPAAQISGTATVLVAATLNAPV